MTYLYINIFYITKKNKFKFFFFIHSCDAFSALLLQSSVLHDSLEINIICWLVHWKYLLLLSINFFQKATYESAFYSVLKKKIQNVNNW